MVIGNKVAHVLAYATLKLWFLQLYPVHRRVVLASGFILTGIGLEGLQGLTGFRSFAYLDMAANSAGIVLGWLLGKTPLSSALSIIEAHLMRT